MSLWNFIRGKFDDNYYKNLLTWGFLPEIHRPSGKLPFHNDWFAFKKTPRTYTSFKFIDAEIVEGSTTHYFTWKGKRLPKAWPTPGEDGYKAKITFSDPITGEVYTGIYQVKKLYGKKYIRFGPRISDDERRDNDGHIVIFPYVNYVPIPGGNLLTIGTKSL